MGCEYCLTTNCPTCEEMTDLLRDARAEGAASALAADRARIAQAIREEMNFPSGIPDTASAILARLLRFVEGG